ncbi:Cytohesin-3 [Smittium culicis]|uniref:Cytohesin-3 n=1 Tax=Smittium culicis TaxID=133412 RepID=A0A1R1WZN6_9FUNG|nr:Cytohesin-3 [Smittium culicis]OMJ10699.1 Cytohesin-3 [Smittium culicis]
MDSDDPSKENALQPATNKLDSPFNKDNSSFRSLHAFPSPKPFKPKLIEISEYKPIPSKKQTPTSISTSKSLKKISKKSLNKDLPSLSPLLKAENSYKKNTDYSKESSLFPSPISKDFSPYKSLTKNPHSTEPRRSLSFEDNSFSKRKNLSSSKLGISNHKPNKVEYIGINSPNNVFFKPNKHNFSRSVSNNSRHQNISSPKASLKKLPDNNSSPIKPFLLKSDQFTIANLSKPLLSPPPPPPIPKFVSDSHRDFLNDPSLRIPHQSKFETSAISNPILNNPPFQDPSKKTFDSSIKDSFDSTPQESFGNNIEITRNESLAFIQDSLSYFNSNVNHSSNRQLYDSPEIIDSDSSDSSDINNLDNNIVLSPLDTLVAELTSELFSLISNQNVTNKPSDHKNSLSNSTTIQIPEIPTSNSLKNLNNPSSTSVRSKKTTPKSFLNKELPNIPNRLSSSIPSSREPRIFDNNWIDDILTKARRVPNVDENSQEPILSYIPLIIDESDYNSSLFNSNPISEYYPSSQIFYNTSSTKTSVGQKYDGNSISVINSTDIPPIPYKSSLSTTNFSHSLSNETNYKNDVALTDNQYPNEKRTDFIRRNNEIRRSRTWNENSDSYLSHSFSNEYASDIDNIKSAGYSAPSNRNGPLDYYNSNYSHSRGNQDASKKHLNNRRWSNSGIYRARDPAGPLRNQLYKTTTDYLKPSTTQTEILSEPPSAYKISPARVGLLKALSRRKSIRLAPSSGKIFFTETSLNSMNTNSLLYPFANNSLDKYDLSIVFQLKETDNLKLLSNIPKTNKIEYGDVISKAKRQVHNFRMKPTKIFTSEKPRTKSGLTELAIRKGGLLLGEEPSIIVLSPENNFQAPFSAYSILLNTKKDFYISSYIKRYSISSKSRMSIISIGGDAYSNTVKEMSSQPSDSEPVIVFTESDYQIVELPPPVPLRFHRRSINPTPNQLFLISNSVNPSSSFETDSGNFVHFNSSLKNRNNRSSLPAHTLSDLNNQISAIKSIIVNRDSLKNSSIKLPNNLVDNNNFFSQENAPSSLTNSDYNSSSYKQTQSKTYESSQIYNFDYSPISNHNEIDVPPTPMVRSNRNSIDIKNNFVGSDSFDSGNDFIKDTEPQLLKAKAFQLRPIKSSNESFYKQDINNISEVEEASTSALFKGLGSDILKSSGKYNNRSAFENDESIKPAETAHRWDFERKDSVAEQMYYSKDSMDYVYNDMNTTEFSNEPYQFGNYNTSRKLLFHGPAYKIMSALNAQTDTYLFLFSDLLVVTRSILNPNINSNLNEFPSSTIDFNPSSKIEDLPKNHSFNILMVIPLSSNVTSFETIRNTSYNKESTSGSDSKLEYLQHTLRKIRKKFNINPYEAVISLVDSKIISPASDKLADFLIRCTELNRRQLGKFLGLGLLARELEKTASADEKKKESMYYRNVWQMYIDRYNIVGIPIDEALRHILVGIRLPNDPMAISSLLEIFSNHWYSKNRVVADSYQSMFKEKYPKLVDMQRSGSNKIDEYFDKIYKSKNTRSNLGKKAQIESVDSSFSFSKNGLKKSLTPFEEISSAVESENFNFIWVPQTSSLSTRLTFAIMTLNAESHNPLICDEITPEISLRDFLSKFLLTVHTDNKPPSHAIPFSAESVLKNSILSQLPQSFASTIASLDPHSKKEAFLRKKDLTSFFCYLEVPLTELLLIWERVRVAKLEQASDMRRIDPIFSTDWVEPIMLPDSNKRAQPLLKPKAENLIDSYTKSKFNFNNENMSAILDAPGIPESTLKFKYNYMNDVYSDPGFKDGLLFNSSTDKLPAKMNVSSTILLRVTVTIPKPDPNYYVVIRVVGSSSIPQSSSSDFKSTLDDLKANDIYRQEVNSGLKINQNGAAVKEHNRSPLTDFKRLQANDTPLEILINDNFNQNSPISIMPSPILKFQSSNVAKFFIAPQSVGYSTIQFLAYGPHARYYSPLPSRSIIVEGGFMLHTLQLTWLKPNDSLSSLQSPVRSESNFSQKPGKQTKEQELAQTNLSTKARYMFGATSQKNKSVWIDAIQSALESSKRKENTSITSKVSSPVISGAAIMEEISRETNFDRKEGLNVQGDLDEIYSASNKADYIFKQILKSQKSNQTTTVTTKVPGNTNIPSSIPGRDLIDTVLSIK